MSNTNEFLKKLLGAYDSDLEFISNVKYDWHDIFENVQAESSKWLGFCGVAHVPSLIKMEDVSYWVYDYGMNLLKKALDKKIKDCEDDKIRDELEKLFIDDDFGCNFKYDYVVVCYDNDDIYEKYLMDEIKEFKDKTGFQVVFSHYEYKKREEK